MIINMYGYIFIRSFFRYFLYLYPVIRCYGTYFSCKINCMFYIQYICWFHPFKKMCTSFKNRMCNGMSSFVRKICFTHKNITESKRLSSAKKSSRGCTFSFHICWYIEEMIMSHDALLFKKHCLDIINEHFWYSPSKQMHSFDYSCHIFLMENK